jgi:tetratricopeptide (TPR) repeat protein
MIALLLRSAQLERDPTRRLHVQLDIAHELEMNERPQEALSKLDEITFDVERSSDEAVRWRAVLLRDEVTAMTDPSAITSDRAHETAAAAIEALDGLGDDRALSDAWYFRGMVEWQPAHFDRAAAHLERALRHAKRAGDARRATRVIYSLVGALSSGSVPREAFETRSRELLSQFGEGVERQLSDLILDSESASMSGDELAVTLCQRALARADELGSATARSDALLSLAGCGRRFRRPALTRSAARALFEALTAAGQTGFASTAAGMLAEALAELGDLEEAERFATIARDTASIEDVASQSLASRAFARTAAHRGEVEQALSSSREAVAFCEDAEWPEEKGLAHFTMSEVAAQVGSPDEARGAATTAIGYFEMKGLVPLIRASRHHLEMLTN